MSLKDMIANDRRRKLNGDEPIAKCCVCFEDFYVGEKAYEDNHLLYCEDCFLEMKKEESQVTIGEEHIESPDEDDI